MKTGAETKSQSISTWQAYALLTFTALCWGGNAVLGRLAIGEVSPVAVVLFRWLGVCLILAPFAAGELRRNWSLLRPHLLLLTAMGSLGFAVFNTLFYIAAHFTTGVNLGILQGSIPIFVLLGVFAVHRITVTSYQLVGAVFTVIGVLLVAVSGDLARIAALSFNFGDVIMVAACMLYSAYTVGLRSSPPASSVSLFAVLAGAALLMSVPLALTEFVLGSFQMPTHRGWLIITLIVIFPSFLAQIAYIHGVNAIGPSRAGIFVNLVPVFAPLLAVIFLGESFEAHHAVALCLVIGGISLSESFGMFRWK